MTEARRRRRPGTAAPAGRGRPRPATPDAPQRRPPRPRGLNENYGRELMELHTLGVDGGYTQHDVIEVARAFTGWTIGSPRQDGGFRFGRGCTTTARRSCSAIDIKAGGGERDGEQVLDILAAHPSTARFIATKLARQFVSDTPPAALVDRAAAHVSRRPTATCAR